MYHLVQATKWLQGKTMRQTHLQANIKWPKHCVSTVSINITLLLQEGFLQDGKY